MRTCACPGLFCIAEMKRTEFRIQPQAAGEQRAEKAGEDQRHHDADERRGDQAHQAGQVLAVPDDGFGAEEGEQAHQDRQRHHRESGGDEQDLVYRAEREALDLQCFKHDSYI